MAQKTPEKVQAIIDKNKKIDILVAFKAAYPEASITFTEMEIGPAEEEVAAILIKEAALEAEAKAEADAKLIREQADITAIRVAKKLQKTRKREELEAELKALDES